MSRGADSFEGDSAEAEGRDDDHVITAAPLHRQPSAPSIRVRRLRRGARQRARRLWGAVLPLNATGGALEYFDL